ncbi:hypothetical protein [Nodosilinea nodulosa]|uniref:hypothetical protein n=1 Tax=Nodosilinea nodulosa TaxID=416001 RepID=UPI0002FE8576|nr:hypothetical protein [Nodosilinea nodulosa]
MSKKPEFFILAIKAAEANKLTIKYLGQDGPVTRHAIEPTAQMVGAFARVKEAIVTMAGFDLGFWDLKDFRISSIVPNLSKYGKELIANDPSAEAELASIECKIHTPVKKGYPSVSSTVEIPWEVAEANDPLVRALEDLIDEAINSLKKPVEQEATQLKLKVLGAGSVRHLKVVGPGEINDAIDVPSATEVNVDDYDYDPTDLLDNRGNPLNSTALPMRQRKLIREGKAKPKVPVEA